jgi:hypothetical protein
MVLFACFFTLNVLASPAFAQRAPVKEKPKVEAEKSKAMADGPKKKGQEKAKKQEEEKAEEAKNKEQKQEVSDPETPAEPATLDVTPALWKIETNVSTVYFLGSIHMLPDNVNWVTPAINTAFKASTTLILETDPNVDDSKMIPFFIQSNGVYENDREIKQVLGREVYAAYKAKWAESGLPVAMRDRVRPWYGSVMLSAQYLQALKLKSELGVEEILKNQARMNGMPMYGLETSFDQLRALADLPKNVQVELMKNTLSQLDETGVVWDNIINSWGSANEAAMKKNLLDDMRKMPALFQSLIINRNRSWIPGLETVLKQKGTHFVAVGAAHLVGDYSILQMLKMKGYRSVRVR